jgi:hypothetical protein
VIIERILWQALKEIMNALTVHGFVAASIVICAGCGSQKTQVTGVLKLEGKIVPGGTVLFTPTSPDNKPAVGAVQPDGTFSMMTEERGDGVMVGKYRASYIAALDSKDPLTRTSYSGPLDKPLDVVSGANEFEINIREEDGWKAVGADEGDD